MGGRGEGGGRREGRMSREDSQKAGEVVSVSAHCVLQTFIHMYLIMSLMSLRHASCSPGGCTTRTTNLPAVDTLLRTCTGSSDPGGGGGGEQREKGGGKTLKQIQLLNIYHPPLP